jgi:hypothetical protein
MACPKWPEQPGRQTRLESRSVRYAVHQVRLQGCRALPVAEHVQRSAHIKLGRDGLFDLIHNPPATLRYEPGTHHCRKAITCSSATDP